MKVEVEIDIDDIFNSLSYKEQEEFIEEHLDVIDIQTLEEYVNNYYKPR